jgi:uncharacterized membrane protein YesL
MGKLISGFFLVSEWISRFAVANLFWLAFTFPAWIVVLNTIMRESYDFSILIVLYVTVTAPLVVFPATSALFAVSRDWAMEKEQDTVIRNYWNYYKENYKSSLKIGIVLTTAWVVTIGDIFYFSDITPFVTYVFVGIGLFLFVVTIHSFSVMVHYDIRVLDVLKKALFFTVAKPLISFIIIMTTAIILFVSVNQLRFLLVFFSFSIISFISISLFLKVYSMLIEKK